jgi:hypothetical protein
MRINEAHTGNSPSLEMLLEDNIPNLLDPEKLIHT